MSEFKPGQLYRIGPRYNGNGTYISDNGTGDLVRLQKKLPPRDWYATKDVFGGPEADWDYVIHESRLRNSELVEEKQ